MQASQPAQHGNLGRYWSFFWPLALGAVFLLAGQQAYNGVLARAGSAGRELAIYACAAGVFFFFDIGTAFMPNMVTVYARSAAARERVFRFCLLAGALLGLPVWIIGATSAGAALLRHLYSLDAAMLADVQSYLVLLSGLVLLHAVQHYHNGLLILEQRTTLVSVIGVAAVAISVAVALHGLSRGWSAVHLVAAAEWAGGMFKLLAQYLVSRGLGSTLPARAAEGGVPRWRELLAFFWPVCVSGMTFGISRPLVFAFVARVPDSVMIIAAMRVAMDFMLLYQSVVNQFRHFFATFGVDDLPEKRGFMALVALGMTAAMALVLLIPPASDAFFAGLLGLDPALYAAAHRMCLILLVVPGVLMIRNYYHGILLAKRLTSAMATGSAGRVVAITVSCWLLLYSGHLNAGTAVLGMIAGFVAEMLLAWWAVRRLGA
jgi:Progressive ankylosis protein (ANKH)